jgi:hypothetical protein
MADIRQMIILEETDGALIRNRNGHEKIIKVLLQAGADAKNRLQSCYSITERDSSSKSSERRRYQLLLDMTMTA